MQMFFGNLRYILCVDPFDWTFFFNIIHNTKGFNFLLKSNHKECSIHLIDTCNSFARLLKLDQVHGLHYTKFHVQNNMTLNSKNTITFH